MTIWHLIKTLSRIIRWTFDERYLPRPNPLFYHEEILVTPGPFTRVVLDLLSHRPVCYVRFRTHLLASLNWCAKANNFFCYRRKCLVLLINHFFFFIDFVISFGMSFWNHLFDNIQSNITTRIIFIRCSTKMLLQFYLLNPHSIGPLHCPFAPYWLPARNLPSISIVISFTRLLCPFTVH